MLIRLNSLPVPDQQKALDFYTGILGFVKKHDVPLGEHRWITVVAANEQDGPELVLEPMAFAPAKAYYDALFEAGIPATAFLVTDVQQEYERLRAKNVVFSVPPTPMGPVTIAVFDDTCGHMIQMYQV